MKDCKAVLNLITFSFSFMLSSVLLYSVDYRFSNCGYFIHSYLLNIEVMLVLRLLGLVFTASFTCVYKIRIIALSVFGIIYSLVTFSILFTSSL